MFGGRRRGRKYRAVLRAVNPADASSREFILSKSDVRLGTDDSNDIVLRDPTVSRCHAVIRLAGGEHVIEDLGSTNGSSVNGRRVSGPVKLRPNDEVRFGDTRFFFSEVPASRTPALRTSPIASLKSRLRSLRVRLEVAVLLVIAGFAAGQLYLYRTYRERAVQLERSRSVATPAATLPTSSAFELPASSAKRTTLAPAPPAATPAGVTEKDIGSRVSAAPPPAVWVERVNYYRSIAGLTPVVENPVLSDGAFKHARYLIENYGEIIRAGGDLGAAAHDETETKPWYTPEGRAAAKNSNLYEGCSRPRVAEFIDGWVTAPFHRLAILDPSLTHVGWGFHENNGCWVAVLDLHPMEGAKTKAATVVRFPADGAVVKLRSFDGSEWPPPLTSCTG
ncbi:MAG: FHA domain-containing protein, partial [Candidatus Binataceae bacterium]